MATFNLKSLVLAALLFLGVLDVSQRLLAILPADWTISTSTLVSYILPGLLFLPFGYWLLASWLKISFFWRILVSSVVFSLGLYLIDLITQALPQTSSGSPSIVLDVGSIILALVAATIALAADQEDTPPPSADTTSKPPASSPYPGNSSTNL